MDMQLSGKTAVVTGASRGIGLAIVRALVAEGMTVVAGARTITPELAATGATAVEVDLSTADGPAALVERAGELDLLVNNVGGGGAAGGFLSFDEEHWRHSFELNYFSAVRATRAALPALVRQRGAIVNISSIGARAPHSGPIVYTTAKAALTSFGKAIAEEFGPQGVRVNTISPGPTRTDLWVDPDGYGGEVAASLGVPHEQLLAGLPAQAGMSTDRLIEPAEVAALVTYLASPHAAGIRGADHIIDGGALKSA